MGTGSAVTKSPDNEGESRHPSASQPSQGDGVSVATTPASDAHSNGQSLPPVQQEVSPIPTSGGSPQTLSSQQAGQVQSGKQRSQDIAPPTSGMSHGWASHSQDNQSYSNQGSSHSSRLSLSSSGPQTPDQELSSGKYERVHECLWTIGSFLGIHFDVDAIFEHVEMVTCEEEGELDLCVGGMAKGIYIVDSGEVEIMVGAGDEVVDVLRPDGFCGELSALFKVPQLMKAYSHDRVQLLLIRSSVVQEHLVGAYLSRDAMLQWCVKRSHVEASKFFKHGTLCQEIVMNCFKCSSFKVFSEEALSFVASMVKPLMFSKGDTLYEVGDDPVYVYFILRGSVEFSTDRTVSGSKTVKFSDEGFHIGDTELFSGKPTTQQVTALTPLIVVPVGMEVLIEMANQFSEEVPKLQQLVRGDH